MFKIQKLDFLISIYIFCIVASELMGSKTFPLLKLGSINLSASVAIFFIPLVYTINDVITEIYGKARAQSVVRSGLVMILLLFLFSLLAVNLPSTQRFMSLEKSYEEIFKFSARISAASLIAFTIGEFSDVFIFYKLRQRLGKKALWFRTNASNFLSEFLDTFIFMTLAFYALDKPFVANFSFLFGLILPYWLIKCLMSIIETPLAYIGVKWLGKDVKYK
jgi:queuosine precursor transporter